MRAILNNNNVGILTSKMILQIHGFAHEATRTHPFKRLLQRSMSSEGSLLVSGLRLSTAIQSQNSTGMHRTFHISGAPFTFPGRSSYRRMTARGILNAICYRPALTATYDSYYQLLARSSQYSSCSCQRFEDWCNWVLRSFWWTAAQGPPSES